MFQLFKVKYDSFQLIFFSYHKTIKNFMVPYENFYSLSCMSLAPGLKKFEGATVCVKKLQFMVHKKLR